MTSNGVLAPATETDQLRQQLLGMLGAKEPLIYRLVPSLVKQMGAAYPELVRAQPLIGRALGEVERLAVRRDAVHEGPDGRPVAGDRVPDQHGPRA